MTVTLVTGGGSGIGAALCRRLSTPGIRLAVHTGPLARQGRGARDRVARRRGGDGGAGGGFQRAGPGSTGGGRRCAQWGALDQLVHLAGFADRRPVGVLDAQGFEASMAANATAFFHLATAAVAGLVRSLAVQLAPEGITVNCVGPGFIAKKAGQHTSLDDAGRRRVETLVPKGRFGQAEEAAAAIAFLLGPEAGYITGQMLHVDGGLTL